MNVDSTADADWMLVNEPARYGLLLTILEVLQTSVADLYACHVS